MVRRIGPDEGSREVRAVDQFGYLRSAVNQQAQLWADPDATIPADMLWLDGTPVQDSTVTLDGNSFLPDMQWPDGKVDKIYGTCNGGPAWPVYARTDERLDALEDGIAAAETPSGAQTKADAARDAALTALGAHATDTTGVHGIADTSALVLATDPRLSNARTPTGHAATHAAGGTDVVTPLAIGAARTAQIDAYTAPGTYTWSKPAGAKLVHVVVVSGGAGGGSGRRGAAGTVRVGGGGGAGGAFTMATMEADQLPATVPLVVGSGGAGGPAKTTDNTDGQNGGGGFTSVFGSTDTGATADSIIRSGGTLPGGFGGAGTGGTGGTATFGMWAGSSAGSASTSGSNGSNGSDPNAPAGAPGGGGGGVSAANVAGAGGAGGVNAVLHQNRGAGGVFGNENGKPGRDALTRTASGGNGGGGGAGGVTGPGGNGGNGGYPGGGGGGGGASANGFNSGAGGRGGDGLVAVITYF